MLVVEGWSVEGGGEEVVLAVRGAERENGGGGPGVVGLDGGLSGGEEGCAGHFCFFVGWVVVSYEFNEFKLVDWFD